MNAPLRLLEGTGGKIAVAAAVGLLVIGATCVIFWSTILGWQSVETPTTNIGSALARTKSAAPKAPPGPDAAKQGAARSRRNQDEGASASADDEGPQEGEGQPRHVCKIEPLAKPSTLRVCAAASLCEADARTTALRLSTSLVHEADRFTVWFLDDETFLDDWTGGKDLEAEAAEHALWRVDTSRTDDGAFQVDTIERLRDSAREPRP